MYLAPKAPRHKVYCNRSRGFQILDRPGFLTPLSPMAGQSRLRRDRLSFGLSYDPVNAYNILDYSIDIPFQLFFVT